MIDIEVTRWPVFIYANYRTRSSPLLEFISKKYQVAHYAEPGQIGNGSTLPFLEHYRSGDKKYIVKSMPDQQSNLPELNELLNSNCFKIKVTRDNELDQIVSHYIATMTNVWGQLTSDREPYKVGIDYSVLDRCINYIVSNNKELANNNIVYDLITNFDELGTYIPLARTHPTTMPENLELIKQIIKRRYEQR